MNNENSSFDRVGSKRYKRDFDESPVPSTAQFNFFVEKKLNRRLFDPETVAQIEDACSTHSNVSNRLSRQGSKDKKNKNNQLAPVRSLSTETEPAFINHQALSYSSIAYLQLIFNTILIGIVLYVILSVILILKQDLMIKEKEHMEALHQEKSLCTKNYMINRCGESTRVPAIEKMCEEWSACMQKDMVVARAKVSAEAFGEILSSFVEPISYKALLFFALLIMGSLLTSNMTFSLFYKKRRHLE